MIFHYQKHAVLNYCIGRKKIAGLFVYPVKKIIDNIEFPYVHAKHTGQELMCTLTIVHQFFTRMLSMRIPFPIFQMLILYILSMLLRNL
jgi:hypothetical protein